MSYTRFVKCDECHGIEPIPEEGGRIPNSWWAVHAPVATNPDSYLNPLHFCDADCLAGFAARRATAPVAP